MTDFRGVIAPDRVIAVKIASIDAWLIITGNILEAKFDLGWFVDNDHFDGLHFNGSPFDFCIC